MDSFRYLIKVDSTFTAGFHNASEALYYAEAVYNRETKAGTVGLWDAQENDFVVVFHR